MATGSSWKMGNINYTKVPIDEASQLARAAIRTIGFSDSDAESVAHHIFDTELRGYSAGGFARIVALTHLFKSSNEKPRGSEFMKITRESASSAQIDGNHAFGYLVALKATQLAISKAKAGGIGIVAASDTFYTGMLSYYAELCAAENLVCIITSSSGPWIAPHGSYTPRFGTNPICIAFPSSGSPTIWDAGTSQITHAQLKMAQLMGEQLPPGMAYDEHGEETRDPFEAMKGSLAVWGGHKGSGLAIAVQLMGALAGAPAHTTDMSNFGHFTIVMDPEMFRPLEEFKKEVDMYSETIRASTPLPGHGPVRMPFDRSAEIRKRNLERGFVEVETTVIEELKKYAGV